MTDSDLTKYDWRRRLGDGGSGVYDPVHVTFELGCVGEGLHYVIDFLFSDVYY